MKFKYIYSILISISLSLISDDYLVNTSSGISSGILKNNVINWDDIPYAEPPVGELRWKSPREILLKDSNKIILPKSNNFCVQEPSGLGGAYGDSFFSGTEDCLYLDIKAPASKSNNKLPVMFWIHGGGNTSGLKDLYDFSPMIKKHNVIVITINYRLGPFGWFTHPAIQNLQSGLDKSSNFGTLDIIAALKWVNKNISLFGGDPNNVTIFGESAGGHNVLSLLVSEQAKGLFHKAISQSGYTTSYTKDESFKPSKLTSTSKHSSWNVVNKIIEDNKLQLTQEKDDILIRDLLIGLSAEELFSYYINRIPSENLPLLTADGVVIPLIGLKEALSNADYVTQVPVIAGSNRDEVKLWLASSNYFVNLEYSILGSLFNVPKVTIKNKKAFNAFNSYRSRAWKIRGVDIPLHNLNKAGTTDLYAYRFDWDDHRRFFIADFQELIGSAHATEIPLLTGNNKLVGNYGFFIYPKGMSKKFTSKNMMHFWTNFAKTGEPGISSNGVKWTKYFNVDDDRTNYLVLDRRNSLRMQSDNLSFKSLVNELYFDKNLTNIEKCVVFLQMTTYVGEDVYNNYIDDYPGKCDRNESETFIIDNSGFIEF